MKTLADMTFPILGLPVFESSKLGQTDPSSGAIGQKIGRFLYAHDCMREVTDGCDFITRHGILKAYLAANPTLPVGLVNYVWLDNPEAVEKFIKNCKLLDHRGVVLYEPTSILHNDFILTLF